MWEVGRSYNSNPSTDWRSVLLSIECSSFLMRIARRMVLFYLRCVTSSLEFCNLKIYPSPLDFSFGLLLWTSPLDFSKIYLSLLAWSFLLFFSSHPYEQLLVSFPIISLALESLRSVNTNSP